MVNAQNLPVPSHCLLPPFVLDAYAANRLSAVDEAACLFVDTSGFTPLTTALMHHGLEGAEILAQVLAEIFTPLLAIVYRHGGYVAGFAGDAFKAIFPGLSQEAHLRAVTAAWQIREQMRAHPVQATRFGDFRFAVKVLIASGPIEWRIWRAADPPTTGQQAALLFAGSALEQALAADPLAQAGDVVMTAEVAAHLPADQGKLEPVADHFRLHEWTGDAPATAEASASAALVSPNWPLAHHFFPAELLERQTQGEFRQVVTLFVNLQTLPTGDEETHFAATFFQLLAQYGGYLCRIGQIGDRDQGGTLLLFWGAPTSYENDVSRALHFALALQQATAIPLRMGITTHLAYAGFVGSPLREEYTCYGAHVNLAARQMTRAGWGEIWLDETTAQLAGPTLEVIPHQRLSFKGFSEERAVYRLLRQREFESPPFYSGTMIGRARELAQLVAAVDPIWRGQYAGVITIIGEAGMGKSRLVHELQHQVTQAANPPQWFLCQTDEILRQPLNPFRHWLRNYFHQSTSQSEAANKAAFTAQLEALLAALAERASTSHEPTTIQHLQTEIDRTRSFLGALVDLYWPDSLYAQVEPQLRFENTLSALKSLILAESIRQSVILHVEDVHWLDVDSHTFLARLVHGVEAYPLAIILTARLTDGGAQAGESASLAVSGPQLTLHLTTLTAEEIRDLATAHLQGPPAPSLVTLLMERAEGNPFFAEQLLHYLREQAWLVQGPAGWHLRTDLLAPTLLPSGARALLVARLDRLPSSIQAVVQTAAVLGREFDTQVLAHMLADDPLLPDKLTAAAQALIWSALTQVRYLFRHALLREAAYDMQLRAQLRTLHRRAAEALQQLFSQRLAAYYGDLAYHYDQAEMAEQAAYWYGQAGELAASHYANQDAVHYLSRALALIAEDQLEARFKLLLAREAIHYILGQVEAQQSDLAALAAIAECLADPVAQAQVMLRRAMLARLTADYPAALAATQAAAERARQSDNTQLRASIHHHWGRVYWEQGNYGEGQRQLTQALQLAEAGQHQQQQAEALSDLGTICFYQGQHQVAQRYYEQSLSLYVALGDRKGEISATAMLGTLASETGKYGQAIDYFQQALATSQLIGFAYGEAFTLGTLGMNHIYLGEYERAEACLRQAIASCEERGDRQSMGVYLDSLAVLYQHLGAYQAAEDACQQALEIQRAIGDQRFAAYSLSYRGDALRELGDLAGAQASYEAAFALRQALGEAYLCQEIQIGLAQVALRQQRLDDARTHTLAVLDWIAEHGIEGIEFPVQLYLHCYQVLAAVGETERALAALHAGYQLLQQRAAQLQAPHLRWTFLEAVPFHRELLQLWQEVGQTQSEIG